MLHAPLVHALLFDPVLVHAVIVHAVLVHARLVPRLALRLAPFTSVATGAFAIFPEPLRFGAMRIAELRRQPFPPRARIMIALIGETASLLPAFVRMAASAATSPLVLVSLVHLPLSCARSVARACPHPSSRNRHATEQHDLLCRKAVPAHARLTCDPPKYCVSAIERPRNGVQHLRNVLNSLACIGRDADCDSGGGVLTWSPLS
ncbi:MAG TPA: hypothetical protein VJW16_01575 [Lysobacter sp.]|nr:hypothetical protein [Lysobacter sp.]